MKFYLPLLRINRDFDDLVDISASQTDKSTNFKSIVSVPNPDILGICRV